MPTSATTLLLLSACLAASPRVRGQELPFFGRLPDTGKNWKLREQGGYGDSSFQWHWIVRTNVLTGDVLSFAAHRFEPGEIRELIYLSDTAHEIFPDGYPSWVAGPQESRTGHSIGNGVVKLEWTDAAAKQHRSHEALEYTFVLEEERGTNRMAHGYALVFGEVAVYVQHTSTKPITREIAHGMAMSLLYQHSRQKPATVGPSTPKSTEAHDY